MKCMVIGSGGREHAMAWKLAQTTRMETVYVAPGNAGTALEGRITNLPLTDLGALAMFAEREKLDFTVVGPEAPLAAGVVDVFRARGLPIFGPTKAAAQIEASKDFAKSFMKRYNIPTADSQTFTDAKAARAYVAERGAPIVVKADGLASGKGVVVATTLDEANRAIDDMLLENRFGGAGARVVIEDFLEGEEASFIAMIDGRSALVMATSQDHKRLQDGDQGPNTGGMGAYSPAPIITPTLHGKALREIIMPVVNGMAAEGTPYTGFLYAGLMIDRNGDAKALEFNARLGDPETQVIMTRMKSDFSQLVLAGINGRLDQIECDWDRRTAMCVVIASAGYPVEPRVGDVISGYPPNGHNSLAGPFVFHAGTKKQGDSVVTHGGRVLGVTALGDTPKLAQNAVYDALRDLRFDGMQYRRDIGNRAIPQHMRR